jgi:hypothetical protein
MIESFCSINSFKLLVWTFFFFASRFCYHILFGSVVAAGHDDLLRVTIALKLPPVTSFQFVVSLFLVAAGFVKF